MATLVAAQAESLNTNPGPGDGGSVKCAVGSYTLSAALAAADVIQMVRLPAGAKVVDVILVAPDLDTGGTPAIALDVGYGGDADYFIDGSDVGQAGGLARASAATAKPLTLTEEDTIDITVATGPATGATSGTITLSVFYTF